MFKLSENEQRSYAKIALEFDSRKKGQKQLQVIEGDEETIASLIGATIKKILDEGFDRKLLEYAIDEGLGRSKKNKIQVKEIHISEENAKDFEELLKKLTGEDK